MTRRTKIIATLGPSSKDDRTIVRLLKSGADVIRLNLSHGTTAEHRELISRVRRGSESIGSQIPIMLDLMGPRYRLGVIPEGKRRLRRRQRVALGHDEEIADVPLDSAGLLRHIRPKERILIDNGLVELEVERCAGDDVIARVITGGVISTRKGINLPDSNLPFQISAKDLEDIRFAAEQRIEYLAASYVGSAADVEAVRKQIEQFGDSIPIVAKIERARAVERIDEIVAAADGVMVARGDLGVEVPLHRVPTLQKRIIDACRLLGRPAIVATQMLESMIDNPRPTRAEVSDVANSVFDGTDALLLTGETAVGRYPIKAVQMMDEVISEAETYAAEEASETRARLLFDAGTGGFPEVADAVARAAVFTSHHLGIRHIIVFSRTGFTVRMISRYRPQVPVFALTPDDRVARRMQILWGVRPLLLDPDLGSVDEIIAFAEDHLRSRKLARRGDRWIILKGGPGGSGPQENSMRVHEVSH